ncbi:MAG: asparagine synthetase B, partial [Proteobacteria bacterium]|nr:asparagine synthetase B [Pseudomonadota bacterium]
MCGIVGLLSSRRGDQGREIVATMRDALVHRGPDAEGVWSDPAAGVTLGHRRLAIIDISPGGAQPMASRCERFVIVFNGEIYNYRDLRRDLQATENIAWRGSSDTEVLLEAVGRWGFEGALARLQGQFAFALWDRAERRLRLARDRFGEKPLYYGWAGGEFVFGSELKALRRHPDFDGAWDRDAVAAYLKYGYVPQPLSIYRSF